MQRRVSFDDAANAERAEYGCEVTRESSRSAQSPKATGPLGSRLAGRRAWRSQARMPEQQLHA